MTNPFETIKDVFLQNQGEFNEQELFINFCYPLIERYEKDNDEDKMQNLLGLLCLARFYNSHHCFNSKDIDYVGYGHFLDELGITEVAFGYVAGKYIDHGAAIMDPDIDTDTLLGLCLYELADVYDEMFRLLLNDKTIILDKLVRFFYDFGPKPKLNEHDENIDMAYMIEHNRWASFKDLSQTEQIEFVKNELNKARHEL